MLEVMSRYLGFQDYLKVLLGMYRFGNDGLGFRVLGRVTSV